jgi:ornithine cyclodeaminase/alanine dehydrogenase-like protein (mu-crystallin family)
MMSEHEQDRLVVLDRHEVARLLPMDECVDVMAGALATVARGNAILPLRPMIRLPDSPNIFALMPAYLGEPKSVGVKVLTVFPVNHGTPIDAHQGAVLLFEADHGRLLAILDATTVTAIRTAAVSAVATRLLAREDADEVAILGAGTQGRMHLEAMTVVRPVRHVHIWSRTTEHARSLAHLAREKFDLPAEVCSTPAHAVERASIVCTTTAAATPVLEGAWLRPGTHVNAVGACIPTTRELDTEAVRRARLYVDRRESALAEPGDILVPLHEGAIGTDHIVAEIGELLIEGGDRLGRRDEEEVTLFKSLGLAVEDLAAAHHVYRKAQASGTGSWIALGGAREEAAAGTPA